MHKKQLGDLLVEAGIITVTTLERALDRQRGSGKRLGTTLEEMGVITEDELVQALARQFGLKTVRGILSHQFPDELIALIPEDIAVQKLIFPLRQKDGMLAVAINDPFDTDTIDYLAKKTGRTIVPILAGRNDILAAVNRFYLKAHVDESGKRKILVVDDSPSIATIIKVALEKEGYAVEIALDGLEGVKQALAFRPELIICDSVMPRMDGYGLQRSLQAHSVTAKIPIILLTSKASGEDEQRALDSGFLDFIAKPVQPIRVVSRVKRAFEIISR